MSIVSQKIYAKLSWIEEKTVCFDEKWKFDGILYTYIL